MDATQAHRQYRVEGAEASAVLADIASDWGYDCTMSCRCHRIAEGVITARRLPCGVQICASDLRTPEQNVRSGRLGRFLLIAINLDGSGLDYVVDDGAFQARVTPGGAAIISAREEATLSCRYRAGDSSRILVLQASTDSLHDDELAEYLDWRLTATTVSTAVVTQRTRALAHELFAPSTCGIAGRLYAESCALELLARAIDPPIAFPGGSTTSARDVASILRVRDKLVANLDADHRLSDLARDAGMSLSTLKSKFVAVTGQPVFQFLRDCRLDRARKGLREDGWSVTQASHYVGYRHPTNFATAFRRRFGISPKDAR